MELRTEVKVTYTIIGFDKNGDTIEFSWDKVFDAQMYEEDVDGIDITMMNTKTSEYRKENGNIMVTDFSIDRNGYVLMNIDMDEDRLII